MAVVSLNNWSDDLWGNPGGKANWAQCVCLCWWVGATLAYGIGIYVVFVSEGLISNLALNLVQNSVLQGGKQDLNCVLYIVLC